MIPLRLSAVLLALAAVSLEAAVSLPALVSDHMVLQRDEPVRIWGRAAAGEAVTVRFTGLERRTTADANGRWEVFLPPHAAGGPFVMEIEGANRLKLTDILYGEVWLTSGQSNMEWQMVRTLNAPAEVAAARQPLLRLFHVPHRIIETPQEDVNARWELCTPESIPNFSAVAYFFGRHLAEKLKVPVGLIESARGGTPAEAWISDEALRAHPELHYYPAKWARLFAEYPAARIRYDQEMKAWEAAGKDEATRPKTPLGPGSSSTPSVLFNGMIAPLVPYSIRGALWYQGETNASRAEAELYRTLFPALITDWRTRWGQGDFPFLFVQLANYGGAGTEPGTEWPQLRDAQREALRLARTAMVVTQDIGDTQNIHPKNKQDVGLRLALAARAVAYGEPVTYSGPLYRRLTVEGDTARLWFDHLGGGLRPRAAAALEGFWIAGSDRVFHPAEARIDGPNVLVRSAAVARPAAVRYAWTADAPASFMNAAGLPASPFRTDAWAAATLPEPPARPVFGKEGWRTSLAPDKPNVLLIGDSISIGYTREVRYLLRDAANVARPVAPAGDQPANCQSTAHGLAQLDQWLGGTHWDVIHFNWGLHDLCYRNPASKEIGQRDKVNGRISVAPEQYEKNLETLVRRLEQTGACLVFANTTTVPEGEVGRFPGDDAKYNAVAARVMAAHGIPTTDLYGLTSKFPAAYFLGPGNVHYGPKANWILGQQVADSVRGALGRCALRPEAKR